MAEKAAFGLEKQAHGDPYLVKPRATMVRLIWWICGVGLALATAGVALAEIAGLLPLAEALEVLVNRLPTVFPVHMLTGALALAALPLVIGLRKRPRWHRPAGRVALMLTCVAGVTALPSALMSTAGPIVRAGLFAQGCVWLALGAGGFAAIKTGRRALHMRLMLCMASVAFGAVVLRLMLQASVVLELDFEQSYACIAWSAWLGPLALTAALTRPIAALR